MTTIKAINYTTNNKIINKILIDENHINVIIPENGMLFEYKNGKQSNKIVVVQFKYKENIVSQSFYQCDRTYKYTWLPFDGIKARVDDTNKFCKFFDTIKFQNNKRPFGCDELMAVSYILGGGIWVSSDEKFKNSLDVEDRISYIDIRDTNMVNFEDSLYINHYINYSVSSNYINPKNINWMKGDRLDSAFMFSYKMNNSHQIEYTPETIDGATSDKDYFEFYKKVDFSDVPIEESDTRLCNIL